MMTDKQLLALYGLKYNPFQSDLPPEALWLPPGAELFLQRMEQQVNHGGFALLTGDVGVGKSRLLQRLAFHLSKLPEVIVGCLQRPRTSLSDFYRELGEMFGVKALPSNRYGGFKALRERWTHHIQTTLFRPVILIDEAQEASADCLTELRLLASEHFDARNLLTVVLCGDGRLPEKFRSPELLPLGSRIRARMVLDPLSPEQLEDFLAYSLDSAGAPHLMTTELKHTLCGHVAGNLRILTQMASDLLAEAARRGLGQLDEKLFIELFSLKPGQGRRRTSGARS